MSRPLCVATLAMAAGICLAHWHLQPGSPHVFDVRMLGIAGVLLVCVGLLSLFLFRHRHRSSPLNDGLSWLALVVFFGCFGVVRYAIYAYGHHVEWPDGECMVEGIVASPPTARGNSVSFRLCTTEPRPHVVLLHAWSLGDSVGACPALGDYVSARACVGRPRNRGNPDEFDYAGWLWSQGVSGVGDSDAGSLCWRGPTSAELSSLPWLMRLRVRALQLRERLLLRLDATGLDGQALAVVSALTLADRSHLTSSTRDLYADAGASHLLALSGLHLGVLVGALLTLIYTRLRFTPLRLPLCVVALSVVWGFSFVAGLPTSLVRASLMATLAVVAVMSDRYGHPLQHLVLTVTVMLVADPTYLFDVGAQLSVASVAGIILFYAPVQRWASRRWRFAIARLRRYRVYWPVQLFHVSVAAQVLTVPLVAWHFGRIPLYGSLTSILLVPLTTVIIHMSLALLAVGGGQPWLSQALGWGVEKLVAVQTAVVATAGGLPGAVVPDFWSEKATPQVVVYNNRRCPAMHFIAGPDRSWLLMPHPEAAAVGLTHIANTFWLRRLTKPPQTAHAATTFALGNVSAAMVCKPVTSHHGAQRQAPAPGDATPPVSAPKAVSLLWLCDAFRGHLSEVLHNVRPRMVVLDPSLPARLRRRLAAEASAAGLRAYDVAEQGALRLRLP